MLRELSTEVNEIVKHVEACKSTKKMRATKKFMEIKKIVSMVTEVKVENLRLFKAAWHN